MKLTILYEPLFPWNTFLQILRSDIIEDCGESINPYIDIGQIEGHLIMGFGSYTSEAEKYNPDTGEKLSNGTLVRLNIFIMVVTICSTYIQNTQMNIF